jgi:signal transduction histidine kinase
MVDGVRDELHRLVLNLLENAVRHTPPGTGIEASTEARDGAAVLIVQDSGPGIPAELSDRVFERFVRGGRDGAKGSGLGLAIVRSVAQSHGGTVSLETPDSGVGTRFVISIPTPHVPTAPAPAAEPAENGAGQTSTTTGRTIGRRRSRS